MLGLVVGLKVWRLGYAAVDQEALQAFVLEDLQAESVRIVILAWARPLIPARSSVQDPLVVLWLPSD